MLDAMQRSSLEIANQSFESEKVKVWLLRLVSENLQMPDELGTGFGLYLMPGLMHGYGVSQPVGGSGKLSESLVRCIEHYGGEVRCNSEVTKILTSGGRATGVRLVDRRRVQRERRRDRRDSSAPLARVSRRRAGTGAGPRRARHAGGFQHHGQPLRFERAGAVSRRRGSQSRHHARVHGERATRATCSMISTRSSAGASPSGCWAPGGDESINDPSRVPPGKGMFHGITFAPYNLEDGGSRALGRDQRRDGRSQPPALSKIHQESDQR